MTAPTKLVSAGLRQDLAEALDRLRMTRLIYPKHLEPLRDAPPHKECEPCRALRRFDYLCDRLLEILTADK